jgi:hypothetical protein
VLSRAGYTNNGPNHVAQETCSGEFSERLKERWFILNDDVRRNILIIHLLMWHKLHGEDLCLQ